MRFLKIAVLGALAYHEVSAADSWATSLHARKQDIMEACPDYVAYSQTKQYVHLRVNQWIDIRCR